MKLGASQEPAQRQRIITTEESYTTVAASPRSSTLRLRASGDGGEDAAAGVEGGAVAAYVWTVYEMACFLSFL